MRETWGEYKNTPVRRVYVEDDRRRSPEIVGDCGLDDIAWWVRRRMWAKVLFDLFVCLVVSKEFKWCSFRAFTFI